MELRGMLRLWLLMLVLVINIEYCYGCGELERIALLQLKASINNPNGIDSLPSWKAEDRTSDCCQWESIECNNITHRVIKLFLNYTIFNEDWYFNASMFLPFESLRNLDLSGNNLRAWVENEGFEKLWTLSNLEVLVLNGNNFTNSILSSLNGLSTLMTLDLSENKLSGAIRIQGEFNFMSLSNNLNLDGLNNLKELDMSGNKLNSIVTNKQGGLCELRSLEELNLQGNRLEGTLPWCLANLTSLRALDISFNDFTGNIASSPLADLKQLEYLVLSNNRFQIPISFGSFFNHSKLKFVESFNNQLLVDTDVGTHLAPSFQLIGFCLSDGGFGNVSTTVAFPNFLYYQKDLQIVDLSGLNFFNRKFPYWLLNNNTRLASLLLSNNSFTGPLYLPTHSHPELLALDISNNQFYGDIPHHITTAFPGLRFLNMSANGFGGGIPSSLGDLSSLEYLDLSSNHLSGEIPGHLAMGCFSLILLKLSNNLLEGPVLPMYNNLTLLNFLYLDRNHFTKIPDSLSNCSSLVSFNFSHNHLSSDIPGSMGNLPVLFKFDMSNNHLQGSIPIEFCQLEFLLYFDLSENNITGTIPSCFNPSVIQHVYLSKNRLQGPLSGAFFNSTSLVILDLSHNHLTGPIPNWIGTLSRLSILLLKNNTFEGEIPIHLCNLSHLSMIDLSFNHFSGHIPPCMSTMTFQGLPYSKSSQGEYVMVTTPYLQFTPLILGDLKFMSKVRQNIYLDYFFNEFLGREGEVEFTTKGMSRSYKGINLDLFSGIDLSCNKLTGQIPHEVGNIDQIRVLNLSHNAISGTIPATLSNLHNLESLDLSFNNLSGRIPLQLTELNYLAKFNVSYNNLFGSIPQGQRFAQFDTFDESCYIGNPLLCGPPVSRTCFAIEPPPSTPRLMNSSDEGDNAFMDMDSFYLSFTMSYITMFLGIAVIFYINPYWRQAWIHLVEVCVTFCYYFVVDNFRKVFCQGNN